MTRAAEVPPGFAAGRSTSLPRPRRPRLFATDEFFGPVERMLKDEPAAFHPGLYDDNANGWTAGKPAAAVPATTTRSSRSP